MTKELKDQIEKEAKVYANDHDYKGVFDAIYYSYCDLATNYAEKLEEKDKIIASKDIELTVWKDTADKFKRLVEEKDKEIEGFKEAVQNLHDGYDICKNDYQKVITKYKSQLESKDHELAQLKEIAEKMAKALEYPNLTTYSPALEALTAYTEWCKQNLR